ncbi:MAG: HD domain-containing protein [Candidatus Pacebacteria bacterium]|nr:HD domain-containing protein [Candidatus Paceibacterota bacterium]
MYTYKIEQAIRAAALLHGDHIRKGEIPLPYITHLVSVAMIVRDYTEDEDTIVAALLHDTIEDTDYAQEELVEDFGENVSKIVITLTEPKSDAAHKISWIDVKKIYAKQLRKGPEESVLIAAADKSHNFRSIVDEYFENHHAFMTEFGPHLDSRLEAYQAIANAINSRLKDGIVHEFNHTFEEYKKFIINVQKTYTKND